MCLYLAHWHQLAPCVPGVALLYVLVVWCCMLQLSFASHAALLCCFLPHCPTLPLYNYIVVHIPLLFLLLFPSSKQVKPPGLSAEACKEETLSATSLVRVYFLSTLALVHLDFCTYLTQVGSGYVPSTGWSTYPSPFPLPLSGRQAGIPTTVCQMPLCPKHAKVE